jgi:hypothetical protein
MIVTITKRFGILWVLLSLISSSLCFAGKGNESDETGNQKKANRKLEGLPLANSFEAPELQNLEELTLDGGLPQEIWAEVGRMLPTKEAYEFALANSFIGGPTREDLMRIKTENRLLGRKESLEILRSLISEGLNEKLSHRRSGYRRTVGDELDYFMSNSNSTLIMRSDTPVTPPALSRLFSEKAPKVTTLRAIEFLYGNRINSIEFIHDRFWSDPQQGSYLFKMIITFDDESKLKHKYYCNLEEMNWIDSLVESEKSRSIQNRNKISEIFKKFGSLSVRPWGSSLTENGIEISSDSDLEGPGQLVEPEAIANQTVKGNLEILRSSRKNSAEEVIRD